MLVCYFDQSFMKPLYLDCLWNETIKIFPCYKKSIFAANEMINKIINPSMSINYVVAYTKNELIFRLYKNHLQDPVIIVCNEDVSIYHNGIKHDDAFLNSTFVV